MKKLIIISVLAMRSFAQADAIIPLYTGSMSGIYYSIGSKLCDFFDCEEKSSSGSLDNLARLNKDPNAIAIVQSDVLKQNSDQFLLVQSLYSEAYTLVVKADSKIKSFKDLKGKNIDINKINSGTYFAVENLLKLYNMSFSDFAKVSYLPVNKQGSALCAGEIDAYLTVVGHPNVSLQMAASECDLTIVPMDDVETKSLLANNSAFVMVDIPKGTYPFSNEVITTIGVKSVLIASKKLPKDQLNQLVLKLKDSYNKLKQAKPSINGILLD